MARLAVIVAQGGISSAGRTSGFNSYKRLIYSALSPKEQQSVIASLNALCPSNVNDGAQSTMPKTSKDILENTLIRKIDLFDPSCVTVHKKITLKQGDSVHIKKKQLPNRIPKTWLVESVDDHWVKITVAEDNCDFLVRSTTPLSSYAAGQLPTGFAPEKLYASRSHPRGLAMTVYGASDALQSLGIKWKDVLNFVPLDQIAVFAGSSMSQMDEHSNAGLLQARFKGERISPKQLPLGFAEMPADFINAYVLGSLGWTGTSMGACATFLYNLHLGMEAIRTERARVAIIGNSEAPLTPDIIEGYASMGALATNALLKKMGKREKLSSIDYRRACRPFGDNMGFVLGESAQFFILMDDQLALEMGASILGAVADVFVNADGYKKSISSPGAGNYITLAKAVALGKALVGDRALRHSILYAHGTGTPKNRVTESHIISTVAQAFGLQKWPVTAIKGYMGHSLAVAAGDQLMTVLGAWAYHVVPGISSIDHIAHDVYTQHLNILLSHLTVPPSNTVAFINSKGFGGNNATATLISPEKVQRMLQKKYGKKCIDRWRKNNEVVRQRQIEYEEQCLKGQTTPYYCFGENVICPEDIKVFSDKIVLKGATISLSTKHPYRSYL